MADSTTTVPGFQPNRSPDYSIVDKRLVAIVEAILDSKGVHGGGGNGGHVDGGAGMDRRISQVEAEVATVKGSLDWAKVVVATMLGIMLAGFSLLAAITLATSSRQDASAAKLEGQISGISMKLAEEFRAQRQDQSAQITAISNAITAAKQAPSQVLLLPAPAPKPVP